MGRPKVEKGLFTLFFQPNSKDGEAEKRKKEEKKEEENKTVHEDNPHQTYKLIYGLIK